MCQPLLDPSEDEASLHPIDVVREILDEVGSLSRLMEVYYLVREPGLLDIMRGLAALPDEDRAKLEAFLARYRRAALNIREESAGALILERQEGSKLGSV